MNYQHITVTPIAGALGAEIGNVDLADLTEEAFAEIHQAWLEHLVIFFRDQDITPDEQIAFARRFGDIHHHPFMKGLEAYPDILEIVKEPSDSYTFGSVWHTDQMFNPEPAKATMLYAKETPSAGGDTMFANMYLALERLSPGMREMLAQVRTFNTGDKFKHANRRPRADRYAGAAGMKDKLRDPGNLPTDAVHPLLRTHPETGKQALYIGSHTQGLDGFDDDEAWPLINFLRDHAAKPEFTCRFTWRPGSMALWDNRCAQHCAIGDYQGERRRMHRITIAGDRPF